MLISIIRYIKGYLRIRIIGYSPERFLNLCSHHHIYLWGLEPYGHTYEMYISIKGFRRLKPIIKKTKTKVVIVKRHGLPFFLHKYRKRKMFFLGAFLCVTIIYVMSLFIWNIHIEGNYSRTDENILEYLKTKDICHGMKKSIVDCSRIVKDIRMEYDDIIWVSASIKGTRLIIKIKENTDTAPVKDAVSTAPSDIVASKDGTIVSMVTRNGVPKVHVGDVVKAGDILVSGRIDVQNDNKETTAYQYQTSDADILAQTILPYEGQMPLIYKKKTYSGSEKVLYYLKIGSYMCSLGSAKHNYEESEQLTAEGQLTIGEHFELPISYGKTMVKHYRSKKTKYTKNQLQQMLTKDFERFCEKLNKKGVQILSNDVKIYAESESAAAKGNLTLVEQIGQQTETEVVEVPKIEKTEGEE